jgi:hypothetical protein
VERRHEVQTLATSGDGLAVREWLAGNASVRACGNFLRQSGVLVCMLDRSRDGGALVTGTGMDASSFQTPLCRMLGLTAPVVQAPLGGAATSALAAAVSNAGGLGMLALTWTPPGSVGAGVRDARTLTDRPFGVNVSLEWDQHERIEACQVESVAVVSRFW